MRESDKIIEGKIKTAVEHASSGDFDHTLQICRNTKGVIPMEKTKRNNTKKYVGIAAAFVFILAAVLVISVLNKPKSVSVVSLDVNPSVMIEVDEKNKVDDVIAVNEDGKKIIGDMKLKNTDVDVALRALIGSMLENGYVNELANSILVSVDDNDKARAVELEKYLVDELNKILSSNINSANVIGQVLTDDDQAIEKLAREYGISKGKAEYIESIIEKNPDLTFDKLAPLSINEIDVLLSSKKIAKPENIVHKGTVSEKAYIGRDAALEKALAKVGATKNQVKGIEVDFDYNNGRMLYDVEFILGQYDYDVYVDAKTGEIVKVAKDLDDDNINKGSAASTATTAHHDDDDVNDVNDDHDDKYDKDDKYDTPDTNDDHDDKYDKDDHDDIHDKDDDHDDPNDIDD